MGYTPLNISMPMQKKYGRAMAEENKQSFMGKAGIDLKDLPEAMNPSYALNIENFFVQNNRGLSKREGLIKLLNIAGNKRITLLQAWGDYYVFGYDTTLALFNPTTKAVTNLKTDFTANSQFSGARYGDYFFVCNGNSKIWAVSQTLTYGTQTGNFTVGNTVVGGTSGATAIILTDVDAGATGTLTLGSITGTFANGEIIRDAFTIPYILQTANFTVGSVITGATSGATGKIVTDVDSGATGILTLSDMTGTFVNGEIITDAVTGSATTGTITIGSATTTSLVTFTMTQINTAPNASIVRAIGPRLFAAVGTDVYYCSVDTGTNPPFYTWTQSSVATDGGKASFRNGGTVKAICSLGDIIIAFGTTGKYAFKITTQNDGTGTIVKTEEVVIDRIDMGGASGAITTPKGVFYVNGGGLWQLISLGQPNIPFSDQEHLTSVLLGTEYFDNVDLTNCDLVYYNRFSTVLVTCAKQSAQNNLVIAFNPDVKAFSVFKNWNINRWMTTNSEVYGGSSVKTALYHCFAGNSDDGIPIGVDYRQEMTLGGLFTRQMLYGAYIKGMLSQASVVTVEFDIYNVRGELEENKLGFTWTNSVNNKKVDGWGTADWGDSSWGGDVDASGLIENFAGMRQYIRNFQRIQIHITEGSAYPLRIDWFSLDARSKKAIRRRNLTRI